MSTNVDINWRRIKAGYYKADGPETGECYVVLREYRRRGGNIWIIKTGWGNDKERLKGPRGYSRNYDTMREARDKIESIERNYMGARRCREAGVALETKGVRSGGSTVIGGIVGGAHWDRLWRVAGGGSWVNASETDDLWSELASEAPVEAADLRGLERIVTSERREEHGERCRIPWSGTGGMGVSRETLRTYRIE